MSEQPHPTLSTARTASGSLSPSSPASWRDSSPLRTQPCKERHRFRLAMTGLFLRCMAYFALTFLGSLASSTPPDNMRLCTSHTIPGLLSLAGLILLLLITVLSVDLLHLGPRRLSHLAPSPGGSNCAALIFPLRSFLAKTSSAARLRHCSSRSSRFAWRFCVLTPRASVAEMPGVVAD